MSRLSFTARSISFLCSLLAVTSFAFIAHANTDPGRLLRTSGNPAVYYTLNDGHRFAFPNERIFQSWFSSFDGVQTVSPEALASSQLSGVVLYHPGTLIKITTVPKVYMVGTNGELRWIETEAVARALFGASWASRVQDIPDAFFSAYHLGSSIRAAADAEKDVLIYSDVGQTIASNQNLFPIPVDTFPPAQPTPTPVTPPAPIVVPTSSYDIGTPTLRDIWVDYAHGNDANNGNSRETAVKTISEAWRRVPTGALTTTGYRMQIVAGTYPRTSAPVYWEGKQGTQTFPVILNAVDGNGTVTMQADINAYQLSHFYVMGINIVPVPAGDAFHCEQCTYTLLRHVRMDGGRRQAHDLLKVNQSQYFFVEDSEITGADDNAIDFVAVQYGHILRSKVSNAQDWCMYVKGGSAYINIEGNEIFTCGTGGFTAGQGTGFEWMTPPWIHYEAYGVTFVNNVIHDTDTAGMGVNGGYNILFAYNTLVRAGTRDHFFEANGGGRDCDGDRPACTSRQAQGGWGGPTQNGQFIPNRNIFVFNNLFYAQASKPVPYMLQIANTYTPPAGSNLTGPQAADTNLQIKGNVFWDGAVTDLGISRRNGGCADTNPTCNVPQLQADNTFNATEPTFANLVGNDFHVTNDALNGTPAVTWPDFDWSNLPTRPLAPAGQTHITITTNKDGAARAARAGAY